MAMASLKPVASLLLVLNLCMYIIVAALAGWALNVAINRGFVIGPQLVLPAHFRPVFFPIGNSATGFFVIFALIASVVGVASAVAGLNILRFWNFDSMRHAAASYALMAWTLTLLAMGLAWKEIEIGKRNARLKTMEAFLIILSVTQALYIIAIYSGLIYTGPPPQQTYPPTTHPYPHATRPRV